MDLFDDVTQSCAEFLVLCDFLGQLPPGIHFLGIERMMMMMMMIHFFVNIGKFRLSYLREFATDFPEASQVNEIRYEKSIHGDEFLF